MNVRRAWRLFDSLEFNEGTAAGRRVAGLISTLIVLNVIAVILETDAGLHAAYGTWFLAFEFFSVGVFTVEYVLRVATCTSDPRFADPIKGRLRYVLTPMALIDLFAILPTYLVFLTPVDLRGLRMLRLFRVFKLTRYSRSLRILQRVVQEKRQDLAMSMFVVVILLVLSSTLMYEVEHRAQPEAFGSIPETMWWSIVTLTTVGYGDVTPITPLGRLLGAVTALLGIGLFALPTGILASGFTDALEAEQAPPAATPAASADPACPHCGNTLPRLR